MLEHAWMIDLNLLATLEILLQERSVSRTAARLGISPAAVSVQLSKLRKHYDDDLFVISNRTLVPTVLAQQLVEPVAHFFTQALQLSSAREDFDPASRARAFSIRTGDLDTFVWLPKVHVILASQYPGISLNIFGAVTDPRRIDFQLYPFSLRDQDQPWSDIYEDHYVCLISSDNKTIGDEVSFSDYFNAKHVIRQWGRDGKPSFETLEMSRLGYSRKIGAVVDSYGSLLRFLDGTPYLSTVPSRFAMEAVRYFPLRAVSLPFAFPSLRVVLQWSNHLANDQGIGWMKQLLLDTAKQAFQSSRDEQTSPFPGNAAADDPLAES